DAEHLPARVVHREPGGAAGHVLGGRLGLGRWPRGYGNRGIAALGQRRALGQDLAQRGLRAGGDRRGPGLGGQQAVTGGRIGGGRRWRGDGSAEGFWTAGTAGISGLRATVSASSPSRARAAFTQRKRRSGPNRAKPTGASSVSMSTRAASEASRCLGTEVSML